MMQPVKKLTNNHICHHEETLNEHSLQIKELVTRSQYKEQTIMELKEDIHKLSDKIDKLTADVNKIINKSEQKDSEIEKRIDNLETKIEVYEKFFKSIKEDQDKRTRNLIAIFAVIATVIGILIKFI